MYLVSNASSFGPMPQKAHIKSRSSWRMVRKVRSPEEKEAVGEKAEYNGK